MASTDPVDRPHDDGAQYGATVTHVGFPTYDFTVRRHPTMPTAVALHRGQIRIVVIVLNATSDTAGPRHLETVYDWPVWRHPQRPEVRSDWFAIFHAASRSWRGIFHSGTSRGHAIQILDAGVVRMTDQMWDMLQSTRTVVLCGGLRGDPSGPEIGAAIGKQRMHAILGQALFE
ncbi:hypothetical protein OG539_43450 [Actinacidiphila glaucinigra]|uniref:hypothetical protein n=1 Tax=Actinacidiphila glaucinigra TaxID=235986 RepID=UPI0032527081